MTDKILKKGVPLDIWGESYKITVTRQQYATNKRTALELTTDEGEPFAVVSVNVPEEELSDEENCFFVDENNCPWAPAWLQQNDIAEPTGGVGLSGFCVYPEFRLI